MIQATGIHLLTVPLPLEEGGLLDGTQVAYETYGEPSGENSVVLLHDLAQSHRALGPLEGSPYQPSGWGRELIGDKRPLDPTSQHVLSVNLLGSPFGTTSPLTEDPFTGQQLGPALPLLTVLDMARTVAALLRALGLKRVRAVLGVGLGGQVALRLAALFPEMVGGVVAIGAARTLPEQLRDRIGMFHQMLWLDPEYKEGFYTANEGPRKTLRKLRLEYLRMLYGRENLVARYRDIDVAEKALEADAEAFSASFDANAWSLLCTAYAGCDLTEFLPKIQAKVLLIAGVSDVLAPPARVRETYHLLSAAGVNARYHELQGAGDHGALLTETRRMHGPVRDFLRRLR
ncbi:alpha/beta fold hydrolase [Hyalangium rubrum]|uniref:Alpha/beta fold hydrolase n=1 Tax=Hyalangium rubrum TaxID=3103134 RepID=A0ABU5H5D5_9BACT|nr:alpha/beta fold hydrolase [Hyalangium sp. s54d21]MDY7228074.1 alpha/beta fold hydrolase [Hyalangium sp. s54d21]